MRSLNDELAKLEIQNKYSMAFDVGHVGVLGNLGGGSAWDWEDDFSTDKGWVEVGTQFTIDLANDDRLEYALKRDGSEHEAYVDALGATISDTAFVFQYHRVFTGNSSPDSYNKTTVFGLSSVTGGYASTQDFLGTQLTWGIDDTWSCMSVNGNDYTYSPFATSFTTTEDYHVRDIRLSATSFKSEFFSDAYSSSVEAETITINSGVVSLRYPIHMSRGASTKTEIQNGYSDDFKLADGVTTAP